MFSSFKLSFLSLSLFLQFVTYFMNRLKGIENKRLPYKKPENLRCSNTIKLDDGVFIKQKFEKSASWLFKSFIHNS